MKRIVPAALCYLTILASLPVVRALVNVLREKGLLVPTLMLLSTVLVLGLSFWIRRRVQLESHRPALWILLPLVLMSAGLFFTMLPQPEERFHLLEYGTLGVLLAWGFAQRPLWMALILGVALGWLDEAVQYFLPTRVYDLRDVFMNAISVSLGVFMFWLQERLRRTPRP